MVSEHLPEDARKEDSRSSGDGTAHRIKLRRRECLLETGPWMRRRPGIPSLWLHMFCDGRHAQGVYAWDQLRTWNFLKKYIFDSLTFLDMSELPGDDTGYEPGTQFFLPRRSMEYIVFNV